MLLRNLGPALTLALGLSASAALAQDTYNVALDGTFAPHAMPKLDGGVEGFNVDFANALAEEMGATFDITAAQWSDSSPACRPAPTTSSSPRPP